MPTLPLSRAPERLITATVSVVARVGYNGATTREIAKLAGVNEGSIFRCFGSRRDLFDAAIATELRDLRLRADLVSQLATAAEPRIALTAAFRLIADIAISRPDLVRMLHFCALEFGDEFGLIVRKHVGGAVSGLIAVVRRWSAEGLIRPVDPLATIISFTATVVAVQSFYPLLARKNMSFDSLDKAVASYVEVWCAALIIVPNGNSTRSIDPSPLPA